MGMSKKESEKLYSLIELAIEKNNGEDNYKLPYGLIANSLRECELHFDYPNQFPRIYQNRIPITYTFNVADKFVYDNLRDSLYILAKLCEEILEDDYELPYDEDGNPIIETKLVRAVSKLPKPPKFTFERCADIIISNIENAEHSILAAVAWFTNPDIMRALIKKAAEGLAIAIIVDAGDANDKRNKQFIAQYPNLNFPIFFASNINWAGYKNFMHHKFCIIDNKIVLHGTFNWTKKAQYNDEDLAEDPNNSTVNVFVDRFKDLRKKYHCFCTYNYPNN